MSTTIRLDKFLCDAGVGSRREVKQLLRDGRVTVDGVKEIRPEYKLATNHQRVTVDGKTITLVGRIVLMLHKPSGYITSTEDPRDPTVMELLPKEYQKLFPIGRLDKDTEGLLLFTNDGELCHQLTSPKHEIEKEYFAQTTGRITNADVLEFSQGMTLKDGTVCKPATLIHCPDGCRVIIREGKYHQVRRMLAACGKPVIYLRREREGTLLLGNLAKGCFRLLTPDEIEGMLQK